MKNMKKSIMTLVSILALLNFAGCTQKEEAFIIKTYEATDANAAQECWDNNQTVVLTEYYELSDGTWKFEDIIYKYRLVISGRMGGAVKDSTFVYLSNIEEITFDQAWKAAGYSSSMDDYFAPEEAKLVELK